MSDVYQSLAHSKWDCKYHVVFVFKRRRKVIFGKTRQQWGAIFHALAKQKECQIVEGHLMPDHVHMCIAIPTWCPRSGSNWNRSANTSASKKPRMVPAANSEL